MIPKELHTILRKCESKIVQGYLRPHLSGELTTNITGQLEDILKEQFLDQRYGEVGGCIVPKNGSLDFNIVEHEEKQRIEEDLQKYDAGALTIESQARLVKYAELVKKHHEEALGTKDLGTMIISCVYDFLSQPLDNINGFEPELRKRISTWYKETILDTIYIFSTSEFSPNHIGVFHVHNNGSEPSPNDVNKNKIMPLPDLVISATPDYDQSGVKLYLVHGGDFELLYQGLLQPKKQ